MVSITRVDTTGDLRYARVYISVLDKSQEKDVLQGLKSAAGFLRRELGHALQLRYTPQLQFVADDSILHGAPHSGGAAPGGAAGRGPLAEDSAPETEA